MNWTRLETLALAEQSCMQCYGLGVRQGGQICNCVWRAIFRACHTRFRQCASKEKYIRRVSLETNASGTRRTVFGLKNEEYIADFCLVSRRALDDYQYTLFKFHYLLGADWNLCGRKMNIDRGTFFHEAYRIEQTLGRAFLELRPHALFPLDEYFGGSTRPADVPIETEEPASRKTLKFPLKGAA
jgi:hypothetical protein